MDNFNLNVTYFQQLNSSFLHKSFFLEVLSNLLSPFIILNISGKQVKALKKQNPRKKMKDLTVASYKESVATKTKS